MRNLMLMVPMLHQGGFERVCIQTARLLEKYYNVTILIFSDKDINYDITGLNIVNINVPAKKGKLNKVVNVLKRVSKTKQMKKELKIDITYSFGSSANLVNVLSNTGDKILTGLRCSTDMEAPRQVSLFTKKADLVLSCSKEIMRELKRDYNYERSRYIYNPLDVDGIQQRADEAITDFPFEGEGLQIIASVGRQDYIKGFWHLVKAFSIVETSHPQARLMIMGTGNWDKYKKMVEEMGIADKVAFTGVKKNPFPYVKRSDLYVLSSNHEGFPNAILEAMALGKPCIAADCKTGPREILLSESEYEKLVEASPDGNSTAKAIDGEYGVIIPDMDQEEDFNPHHITFQEQDLACEIIRMLDNKERMAHYGQKALERARVYEPDKYGEDLFKILEEVR